MNSRDCSPAPCDAQVTDECVRKARSVECRIVVGRVDALRVQIKRLYCTPTG